MKSETFRIYASACDGWVEPEATPGFLSRSCKRIRAVGLEALGEVVSCQEVGEVSASGDHAESGVPNCLLGAEPVSMPLRRKRMRCPLMAQSGRSADQVMRSVFGGNADLTCQRVECHQIRQSHFDLR